MIDNIALIIDTNSNYSDIWKPCFGRMNKYVSGIRKYAFTDTPHGDVDIPDNVTPIIYNNTSSYRNQFLSCIKQIEEEFIIYTSEDYILYDYVQMSTIKEISKVINDGGFSFCKFIKGPEKTSHYKDNLYFIDRNDPNFFAQQASLWKTENFMKVFETAPSENTRMQHEPMGSSICRDLNYTGLQYFSNTNKRGIFHYDSEVYPCVVTAVVKGLWNVSEYPKEMSEIVKEYNIDLRERGWR